MQINSHNYQLMKKLVLSDRSENLMVVHALFLALRKLEKDAIECRLAFQINSELHKRIENEALFNLKPEICVPFSSEVFSPESDIQIEISLQPDFLPILVEHITSKDEAATAFLKLNQEQPSHPLFATENWLLVSAQQARVSGQVGYHTLWDYLSPATLAQAATAGSPDPITDALSRFFKDWTQNNLTAVTEKAAAEVVDGIAHFAKGFADFNLDGITKIIKDFDLELTKAVEPPQDKTILQQLLNFFTEDDWGFSKLQGEAILRLSFQGKNSRWVCYAKAIEEKKQFVFYSVCPIVTPSNKRQAIAEFLTRVNYGMTIGNFELDFSDGEIRYKTSIDFKDDKLTATLIKRLVYTNVSMMDEYLPGIIAVINEAESPEDALCGLFSCHSQERDWVELETVSGTGLKPGINLDRVFH